MEISNEIKAKVLAQYLGQECKTTESVVRGSLVSIRDFDLNPEVEIVNKKANTCFKDWLNRCKLILRPLSAITDEDAIALGKEKYPDANDGTDLTNWYRNAGREMALIDFKDREIEMKVWVVDFLRGRGYDMPNYLLKNKTLKEAGLAIYEEEEPSA